MRHRILALSVGLLSLPSGLAGSLQAQQSMPGMTMPMPQNPSPQPQSARPNPSPPQKPRPNRTRQAPDAMPEDLRSMGHDTGDAKARAAASSEQHSENEQSSQAGVKPGLASDRQSLALPYQSIQEPEATGFHTGTDLPAPELLREVVDRTPMTLDRFLALSEHSNPTLTQAQRDVDRSGSQARQVSLPPDPIVGYSGDHIRGGSYHGGEEGAFFSQNIVLGRKLALRRDVYRAESRSNQFAVDVQRARIRDDVQRAFFHALSSQEAVVVHDRLLKVALDAETNAHERERVGQADVSAVLNAEVAAEQAKIDFEDAQRMFLGDFTQLATVAGQLSLAPQPLTGPLVEPPTLDAEALVAADVTESPAVKRAEANVTVAEARLKSAKRESVPDLQIKAGEWYSGESLGATNKQAGPMAFAEAGVQLPLWNRNQGNTAAARVELQRAQADVLRIQLLTRHAAEPLVQQYESARSTADRYRTAILPRARRSYQLEALKYQQMAQIYPEVLTAQHLLFSFQLSYLKALDAEWNAALALENYTLMNSLEDPVTTGRDDTDLNRPTGSY